MKTPELHRCRFAVFTIIFEHISQNCSGISIVKVEQVNAGWVINYFRFQYTRQSLPCVLFHYKAKCFVNPFSANVS